jgi:hypothetical protein
MWTGENKRGLSSDSDLGGAGLDGTEGFIADDRGIDNHEWSVRVDEAF